MPGFLSNGHSVPPWAFAARPALVSPQLFGIIRLKIEDYANNTGM